MFQLFCSEPELHQFSKSGRRKSGFQQVLLDATRLFSSIIQRLSIANVIRKANVWKKTHAPLIGRHQRPKVRARRMRSFKESPCNELYFFEILYDQRGIGRGMHHRLRKPFSGSSAQSDDLGCGKEVWPSLSID